MARRKTKAERDQQRAEAERHIWEMFRPKLEALQSYVEAKLLVAEAVPPDSPGRRFYSNLGFFLMEFTVPADSSYAEKALYLQFIQRIEAAGELKPGVRQKIEDELHRAMEAQGHW